MSRIYKIVFFYLIMCNVVRKVYMDCSPGWLYSDDVSQICYSAVEESQQFSDVNCRSLPIFKNASEYLSFVNLMQSANVQKNLWLGLSRKCGSSDPHDASAFKWLQGYYRAPFPDYWDSGQPDNSAGSECCAAMNQANNFKWIDQKCTTKTNYVCQCHGCYHCRCPKNFQSDGTGICYQLFDGNDANFAINANDLCNSYNSTLPIFQTLTERKNFEKLLLNQQKTGDWFIGAMKLHCDDPVVSTSFTWLDETTIANNIYNFDYGQPNNYRDYASTEANVAPYDQHCLVISTDKQMTWNDVSCWTKRNFACQRRKCPATPPPTPLWPGVACDTAQKAGTCPNDDYFMDSVNNCYLFFDSDTKTMDGSQNVCETQTNKTNLPFFSNNTERDAFKQLVGNKYKNTKKRWLGLIRPCNQTDVKRESFMWIDNSTNSVYNWAAMKNEPNDEDNYCTYMDNQLTWNDVDCGNKLNYVCQLKPNPIAISVPIAPNCPIVVSTTTASTKTTCTLPAWTAWSTCSVTCGKGQRSRSDCNKTVHKEDCEVPCKIQDILSKTELVAVTVTQSLGCSALIAFTAITIGIFLCLRIFTFERILHMCQEISLLIAHVTLLAIMNHQHLKTSCSLIGIILQYSFLANFTFLALEALQSYCILQNVSNEGFLKLYMNLILGWGIPMVIVAVSAMFYFTDYPSAYSCWLNLGNSVSYFTIFPIILSSCAAIILTEASTMGDTKRLPLIPFNKYIQAQINQKAMTVILALNILSWTFGMLAVFEQKVSFYGLVFIFNICLGIAIFFFHTLSNEKVYEFIKSKLCRKMLDKTT